MSVLFPLSADPLSVEVTPVELERPEGIALSDWLERPVSADGSDVPWEDWPVVDDVPELDVPEFDIVERPEVPDEDESPDTEDPDCVD